MFCVIPEVRPYRSAVPPGGRSCGRWVMHCATPAVLGSGLSAVKAPVAEFGTESCHSSGMPSEL
jgi:hypothetical protein